MMPSTIQKNSPQTYVSHWKNEIKAGSQLLYYFRFLCRKFTLALMQEVLGSILKACGEKKETRVQLEPTVEEGLATVV